METVGGRKPTVATRVAPTPSKPSQRPSKRVLKGSQTSWANGSSRYW